ncbi:hypothetical protein, partial [Oscillatoria salina]|uniref:hypothetical protein n=1 Tax=Oscillatoria salina TaxID=331517 RepID=UPI001CCC8C1D
FSNAEGGEQSINLKPEQIYRVQCWRYVIHVVGKGISTFVGYADLPPILGVEKPDLKDIRIWRKRWRKNCYQAPSFWVKFYQQKFREAKSLTEMYRWGEIVAIIKFALAETALKLLRNVYLEEKYYWENF